MGSVLESLEIPILQAPIGGASNHRLCAAVSEAGGLGGMALTWTAPEQARRKIRDVKRLTTRPFYVNFALTFEPVSLQAALGEGVSCCTFSWGDPTPFLPLVRQAGIDLGIQVANLEGARRALDLDPDFLICQGMEAGGHVQSTQMLADLLGPILAVAGKVPVVASGGITTGLQVANALQVGAAAVAMGTRFLATEESGAHDDYKRMLAAPGEKTTALTNCFDLGWPHALHRVLRNSTLEAWEAVGCPPPGRRPGESDRLGETADGEAILRYEDAQPLAETTGEIEAMCLYAGTGVGAIRSVEPAADVLQRIWAEARRRPNHG